MPTDLNETLDRLMRHMAWANQQILASLQTLPSASLELHAPDEPEWSVYAITRHFVRSAGVYCSRLGADVELLSFEDPPVPTTLQELATRIAEYDEQLRVQAAQPEAILPHTRPDGVSVTRARSTILAQSIHHATEHRAQISSVLSGHGIRTVDLDALDIWSLGDAEALGE